MVSQTRAEVLKNIKIKDNYFKLVLSCLALSKAASPGEFIEIKVSGNAEPLLRRPFSIHNIIQKPSGSALEVLYEVVGQGSAILSKRKPGEYLDIIGPLGKGFSIGSSRKGNVIIIAGGMGVAPLRFLAERIVHRKPLVLIGAKTKSQILCEQDFKKLGCAIKIATDDGSRGFHGYVTELLESVLRNMHSSAHLPIRYGKVLQYPIRNTIYACGPALMLKEVKKIALKLNIPAEISLEAHMACGFGVCLGCVVNTPHGYKRVCKDGPVFQADEVIL